MEDKEIKLIEAFIKCRESVGADSPTEFAEYLHNKCPELNLPSGRQFRRYENKHLEERAHSALNEKIVEDFLVAFEKIGVEQELIKNFRSASLDFFNARNNQGSELNLDSVKIDEELWKEFLEYKKAHKAEFETLKAAWNMLSCYEQFIITKAYLEQKLDEQGRPLYDILDRPKFASISEIYNILKKEPVIKGYSPSKKQITRDIEVARRKLQHYKYIREQFIYKPA